MRKSVFTPIAFDYEPSVRKYRTALGMSMEDFKKLAKKIFNKIKEFDERKESGDIPNYTADRVFDLLCDGKLEGREIAFLALYGSGEWYHNLMPGFEIAEAWESKYAEKED